MDSINRLLNSHNQKDSILLNAYIDYAWLVRNSNISLSFEYSQKALYLARELKNEAILAKLNNHRGVYYRNISDYPEAERRFSEALKIAEKYNNKLEMAYANNNLGDLLRLTNNPIDGIKFMERAKDIFISLKDKKGEAYTYIRLSEAYQKLKQYKDSYGYAEKSLAIRRDLKTQTDISASLNRIGDLLAIQEKYKESLNYYQEALDLAMKNNDATGKVASLQDIGKVYIRTKKFIEADSILRFALNIAVQIGNREQESNIYEFFTELYEKQNITEQAYFFYKKRQEIKDSVFSNQRMLQISQMRVRYDLKDKELQNKALQVQLEKEQFIRIIGILFSIIVAISVFWVYRNSRKLKKANEELERKNEEINTTLESLEQANKAISQKNTEIERKNEEIGLKNRDLLHSIDYALTIQQAILPTSEQIATLLKEHFIIWEPRDIISGDFYWVADKGSKIILVLADCTGHGVPGALMSMMGSNLLNSVIHDKEIHQPDLILEHIHQDLLVNLHTEQTQIINGMDMGICVYDKSSSILYFSGAGIPLYYIEEGQLSTLEPTKTSAGNPHKAEEKFQLHSVPLKENMIFYMASDGYKDQFGGQENKKFGTKRFKQLLQDIQDFDMPAQRDRMLRSLYLWQKTELDGQTDDITVLGFRF
ncbi:MAG: tetratricopeptide repeat protein [Raineya sp.]|nr:tetratricopeptide repeat protein [Raineya sp.]